MTSHLLNHILPHLPRLPEDNDSCQRAQASLEIEAKFRVDDHQIFEQLLTLASLGDATLTAPPGPELQHTT